MAPPGRDPDHTLPTAGDPLAWYAAWCGRIHVTARACLGLRLARTALALRPGGGLGLRTMEPSRTPEIGLVSLAMLAWTVYCLFFLVLLGVPAVEGAAEVADQMRLTIIGGWLLGLAIGAVAVLALWRRTFDATPRRLRVWLAVSGSAMSAVLVIALYWLELSGILLFLWGPLVAGVLLLIGWASTPPLRQRLRRALVGWLVGFGAVATLWFILPPGTLSFHFWTLLALVSLAAAAWWAWALFRARAPSVASR
jgi:hypothetical protein